jgi:hypothetical protein
MANLWDEVDLIKLYRFEWAIASKTMRPVLSGG